MWNSDFFNCRFRPLTNDEKILILQQLADDCRYKLEHKKRLSLKSRESLKNTIANYERDIANVPFNPSILGNWVTEREDYEKKCK